MNRRDREQLKRATDTLFKRIIGKLEFRFTINSVNAIKVIDEEKEKWNTALKADDLVNYSKDSNIS